jgi:hypothetical protein
MHILLIGPYWGNSKHGAEPGVYDALVELGHEVSIWDHRVGQYRLGDQDVSTTKTSDILTDAQKVDVTLCLGPGLNPDIINAPIFKATENSLRILWNSEPIRLSNYREKIIQNKHLFSTFCTFDESEIPLYKDLGITAQFLPQAYNPAWYKPLSLSRSQIWKETLCFMGSIGGKWAHRQHMLQRVKQAGLKVHIATIFEAEKVNRIYNMHSAVLNLGLYCEECGPPQDLKGFGLQQRIFEAIGAGQICITNEIPDGTNGLFEGGKHVLYYNKDNLEAVCQMAFDKKYTDEMKKHILAIAPQHTYKERMKSLIDMIAG